MAAQGSDWVEKRTARDREGVYESGFAMRIVDDQGRHVRAYMWVSAIDEGLGGRVLYGSPTDPDDWTRYRGISSRHPVRIRIDPPEQLRPRDILLPEITNDLADLGLVTLSRNYVVAGLVSEAREDGTAERVPSGRISLRALSDGRELAFGQVQWGRFWLDNFDIEPMEIVFTRSPTAEPTSEYRSPFVVDPERIHRNLRLTAMRRPEGGMLRIEERADVFSMPRANEHRLSMTLSAANGVPLVGLPITIPRKYNPENRQFATDDVGNLSVDIRGIPERAYVETPSGRVALLSTPALGFEDHVPFQVVDFREHVDVVLPTLGWVDLRVRGISPGRVTFSWLDRYGWRYLHRDMVERVFGRPRVRTLVRASGADFGVHISRVAPYPPVTGQLPFDFGGDEPHLLMVVHDGRPVDRAIVDIVEAVPTHLPQLGARHPAADLLLDQVRTDHRGRLELLGDPQALYVAYVYRDGFEPARVGLRAGELARVELRKRNVPVKFTGLHAGEQLRLREAGRDSLVGVRGVVDEGPATVSLAPGTYDATVETGDGVILRGASFNVTEPQTVDLAVDRRARVLLKLPGVPASPEPNSYNEERDPRVGLHDGWFAWVTRRTPAWSPLENAPSSSGWMRRRDGRSTGTSTTGSGAEASDRGRDGLREHLELRLPGSGRWMVHVGSEQRSVDHFFFREVEIPGNGTRTVELPTLDASLMALPPDETGLEDNQGGVAGPRVMLISAGGAAMGWNAVGCFPKRDAGGPARRDCLFDGLPSGGYYVFRRFVDQTVSGGVEVSLGAGKRTRLGIGAGDAVAWTVEVVDAEGRPVTGKTLRIRNRFHEASLAHLDAGTRNASNPEPDPPSRRLRGYPVTFESVRPGWLELTVDDPAGSAAHYLRKVERGKTLRLVVGR